MELPRYKLGVGDQLTYRTFVEPCNGSPASGSGKDGSLSVEWSFYVVGRLANGFCRLVFSEHRTQKHPPAAKERVASSLDSDGYFDLAEDGRLEENWTITPLANPAVLFPRLPADRSQIETGWSSMLQLDDTHRRYSAGSPDDAQAGPVWPFFEDCDTQLDAVYQVSRQRRYAFDRERGLVKNVTTCVERCWPANAGAATSTDSTELTAATRPGGVDWSLLGDEAERYFDTCAEYHRLLDVALWDVLQTPDWLDKAFGVLEEFAAGTRVELVRDLAQRKLKLHRQESKSLVCDAAGFAGRIGTPAPDWRSVDLDGGVQGLKGHAGRVVVLCFWNRGCPWSIRLLLALNALAAALYRHPVVFLGVNADGNHDNAKFVWQTLKMVFPAMIDAGGAGGIASAYGVESFPTTVVVDPCGVIRRIRAGYSPRLSSMLLSELAQWSYGERWPVVSRVN